MALNLSRSRAFGVLFKEMRLWSVGSFFKIDWNWPQDQVKPLSSALRRKRLEVDRSIHDLESLQLVTLHFDGTMEPRDISGQSDFKGKLFFAHAGDVVYSKIDVRNGAIGIVPVEMPRVVVSSEYPVYEVLPRVALPEYIQFLFQTQYFRKAINSMISGASGRKRVEPTQIEQIQVPMPPLTIQEAIIARMLMAEEALAKAKSAFNKVISDLNKSLFDLCHKDWKTDVLRNRWLAISWKDARRWDVNTARASAFRLANPSFRPLADFAEEATELVRPWEEPEREWPVYGVNNKVGVFFSHYQKGKEFNVPYKRIHRDWFFHNPTRSSVGSLGIVPEVPEDALTSPEYQVWRIKHGLLPSYVAVLINTEFFINLIQFHRVGAVKQRLYVDNLLEIRVPDFSIEEQTRIAREREAVLQQIRQTEGEVRAAKVEVEELILGTKHTVGV